MKKIKRDIPLNTFEIIFQVLSIMIVLYITFLFIFKYASLPETIPAHYNAKGEVDGWGDKSSVLLLYGICLVMYIGLTVLERYPQLYNYPVQITKDNIKIQYRLARTLITTLKLATTIIFMLIIASAIRDQTENASILMGNYFIFFALGITFIPIFGYFVLSYKNK